MPLLTGPTLLTASFSSDPVTMIIAVITAAIVTALISLFIRRR